MKKIISILYLLCATGITIAQNYSAGDAGSSVNFTIKNFGLNVTGSFSGLEGKITFDPANTASASFNVSVSASTVNTGNSSRDKHLLKGDYFDASNHPKITFVSTKVTANGGSYTIEGLLTIKGITKKISFPFSASPGSNGFRFTGQFRLNRRDFGVGGSSWVLSNELTVSLNVSATK